MRGSPILCPARSVSIATSVQKETRTGCPTTQFINYCVSYIYIVCSKEFGKEWMAQTLPLLRPAHFLKQSPIQSKVFILKSGEGCVFVDALVDVLAAPCEHPFGMSGDVL